MSKPSSDLVVEFDADDLLLTPGELALLQELLPELLKPMFEHASGQD